MATRDLNLNEFALPRRLRRNSVKLQKCPQNGRRRTFSSRSENSEVVAKEIGKHGRARQADGLRKHTLDVQRIITDLTGVKKALCHNNRLAGRSNRKCDKIFGEVMESILCAFPDISKRNHDEESSLVSYPENSQDSTSTFENFKSRTNFVGRNSNPEDPNTRMSRNPSVWKPKKSFAVVEDSSVEDQIESTKILTSESSQMETSGDLNISETSNTCLPPFHRTKVNKHLKLQNVINSHGKNRQLKDFGDGDSIKLEQGDHIFIELESAMRRNSRDRRCLISKGKQRLVDNQEKDQGDAHQLVDYQDGNQRTRGKLREVAIGDNSEQHICPTCVCITRQRGQKLELRPERKVKARRFVQSVAESEFDEAFRFLEKGTRDADDGSSDEWWKLERDYGHRLHPHKMLPKNHAPVNSNFERKVRQVSKTVSDNSAFETDFLDSYRLLELRDRPSKVKIRKSMETSGSNPSLGKEMRKFVKEFCYDNLNPIREKQKTLPKQQQFDHNLKSSSHRMNSFDQNGQKRKNCLASYEADPQVHHGYEGSLFDDGGIKYTLNDNSHGHRTNRRTRSRRKTSPKAKCIGDYIGSIEINNALKPRSIVEGPPKSPKQRFIIHPSKKACDNNLDEINPRVNSILLKNPFSPNEQLSSEVKPGDDYINNSTRKKENKIQVKRNLHLMDCEFLSELREVGNSKKDVEDLFYVQNHFNKKKKTINMCFENGKQPNTEMKSRIVNAVNEMDILSNITLPLPNELVNMSEEFDVHSKNCVLEKTSYADDLQPQEPQSKIHVESENVNQSGPEKVLELELMHFEDQEPNIKAEDNKDEGHSKVNSLMNTKPILVPKSKLPPVTESRPRNKAAIEIVREPSANFHKNAAHKETETLLDSEPSCPVDESRIDERDVQESVWDKVKRWDEGCRQKNENGPKSIVSSAASTRDLLKKFNSGSDMASMLYGSPPKTFYPPQCDNSGTGIVSNHQRQHWNIPPQEEPASNKNITLGNIESNHNCMEFDQRLTQPNSNQHNLNSSYMMASDQDGVLQMDPYSQHASLNQAHATQPLQPTNNMVRMNFPYQMYGGYGNFPFYNPSIFPYYANSVGVLRPNMFMPRVDGCSGLETNSLPPFPPHSSANDNDSAFQRKRIDDPHICKPSEFNENYGNCVNNPETDSSKLFLEDSSPNRADVEKRHVPRQAQNFMGKCTNGDASASARINKKFNESHQAFNSPANTCDLDNSTPPRYAGAAVPYSSKVQPLHRIQTANLPIYVTEAFQDNSTPRQDSLCFQPQYEGTPVAQPTDLTEDRMGKSSSKRDIAFWQTHNESSLMNMPKDLSEGNQEKSNSKGEIMSCQDKNEVSNRARDLSEVIRDKSTSGRDMKRVLYGAEDSPCSKLQMNTPMRCSTGSVRPPERPPISNDASPAAIGREFSRLKLYPDGNRRGDSTRRPKGIVPCLDNVSFS